MQLSQTDIQEFKELYEAEFQEEISWAKASDMACDLVSLFEALYASCPDGQAIRPLEGE